MANSKNFLGILSLIVSAVTLILLVFVFFLNDNDSKNNDYTLEKKLAGELVDNNLYQAAVDEYRGILDKAEPDSVTRANICYLIAKIYFEHLYDYEKAAAYYVRARALNPDGSFYTEAGRNLITCLEKMGRLADAKRELNQSVNVDSVYAAHDGEKVVAKIDDRPIFQSQLDREIQKLPPEMQKQYLDKEGKREFLNNYIATELMHLAAIREGFDRDPEIETQKKMLEKQLLVEKYVTEKVLPEINLDTADIRNYYLANKSEKYQDKEYDEIKSQVFMDYQNEKARQAFYDYVTRLTASSDVQIFEENIQ